MTYLLDTNVCVKLLNNSSRSIVQRLADHNTNNINLCTVVAFELFYGAYHSQKKDNNLEKLERFLNQFRVIEFDRKAAKTCGSLRSSLNKKGTPIGVYDLQIASIALANNLVLVTHNVAEFSRVEGLQYEDWE